MNFIRFILSSTKRYVYDDASNIAMNILGNFLVSDINDDSSSFKDWLFNPKFDRACGNLTVLDKENGYIILSDIYSEEETPTELKITNSQFLQILHDWEEKVIKKKPKEVTIKYENDQFLFETKE